MDEGSGLENRQPERVRGFESHPLRSMDRIEYDAERKELRDWLRAQGATEAQLAAAKNDYELAADLALARDVELSARDIAVRLEDDVDAVVDCFRAHGVTVPDADAVLFTEADVEFVAGAKVGADVAGHDGGEGRVLARVAANAVDRVAEAAVALYVQGKEEELRQSGAPLVTMAEATTRAIKSAEGLGRGLGVLFRHHLRQAVERQRVSQVGVASRDLARVAIGFVDLAGSTALEETLNAGELRALVSQFEARAFEVAAEHGGRVIKFIGDEIMVATLDPMAGCRMMMRLLRECGVAGVQPRGGLAYGEVLFRGGDYYGPEVNMAARLVQEAIPGEVLVGRSVVDAIKPEETEVRGQGEAGALLEAAAEALVFEPAGRRLLKGFGDPLPVWSVSLE